MCSNKRIFIVSYFKYFRNNFETECQFPPHALCVKPFSIHSEDKMVRKKIQEKYQGVNNHIGDSLNLISR